MISIIYAGNEDQSCAGAPSPSPHFLYYPSRRHVPAGVSAFIDMMRRETRSEDQAIVALDGTEAQAAVPARDRGVWVLAATIIASSMAFIDMSVVNVALPVLQRSIGASFAEAQWIVEAYVLILAALTLAGGAMGDVYGRRRIFGLGILVFALASAACGFAGSPPVLIVGRVFQGIGGAMMVPGSLALLAASFPPDRRGKAVGLWSAASGVMVAVAPALGGWLIHALSWRWVFLINLPLAAVALLILAARVGESRRDGSRGIDAAGAALATLGLGALTYGLIEAGRRSFLD